MFKEFKEFAHELALHIAASGDSNAPLVSQAWFKNDLQTVGDKFHEVSELLGIKVTVPRFQYYAPTGI